jgi:hypothetical protein
VGSHAFVEKVKLELALKARHREVEATDESESYVLREPAGAYTGNFGAEIGLLSPKNAVFWERNPVNT